MTVDREAPITAFDAGSGQNDFASEAAGAVGMWEAR